MTFSSSATDKQAKAAIKATFKAEKVALKNDIKAIKKQCKVDTERLIMDRVLESVKTITESEAIKSAVATDPKAARKLEKALTKIDAAKEKLEVKHATSVPASATVVVVDPEMSAPAYNSDEKRSV